MAIMKNEESNIRDWIVFHALAGVKHFILYDNGSEDCTKEVARSVSNTSVTRSFARRSSSGLASGSMIHVLMVSALRTSPDKSSGPSRSNWISFSAPREA